MLQLNLEVRDENGAKVEALSQVNVAVQQIQAVLMFLRAGYSFTVTVSDVEQKTSSN